MDDILQCTRLCEQIRNAACSVSEQEGMGTKWSLGSKGMFEVKDLKYTSARRYGRYTFNADSYVSSRCGMRDAA
jgi:hypothetical protein